MAARIVSGQFGNDAPLGSLACDEPAVNFTARADGLILSWAASYGTPAEPAFAGIWQPNADAVLWNNDGLRRPAGGPARR